MSYKIGFILSLLFIAQLFVFAADLISVQMIYTNLDAVSVTAANLISLHGGLDDSIANLVYEQTGGSIEEVGDTPPLYGAVYTFRLYKDYTPWVMSNKPMTISITRTVVIGYYS